MVVMAAKWRGKCRVCGCSIAPGTQIEWTKDGGARHLTPEECGAARLMPPPVEVPLRGPGVELPEDRARAVHLLLSHPWKAATSKAYAKLPHEYTLRKQWHDDVSFDWIVAHIRAVGYRQRFIGRVWVYYDVCGDAGAHQYWTMGDPVPETTLINRAIRRPAPEVAASTSRPKVV